MPLWQLSGSRGRPRRNGWQLEKPPIATQMPYQPPPLVALKAARAIQTLLILSIAAAKSRRYNSMNGRSHSAMHSAGYRGPALRTHNHRTRRLLMIFGIA
jgi:hypothetical protein